jgi:hypothetical protein
MNSLRNSYPEQFAESGHVDISIGEGWMPIVERALQRVRRELTPDELTAFRWLQIKEKFGTLRMYWNSGTVPVTRFGSDGILNLSLAAQKVDGTRGDGAKPGQAPAATADADDAGAILRAKIDAIVEAAKREAMRTCEHCGQPGRLYAPGYCATLCDAHAEGRLFPPVYGEWLDARDTLSAGSGTHRRVTERVMYFRGVELYSWRSEKDGGRDHVLIADLPDWLAGLLRAENAREVVFQGRPAYDAEEIGRLVEAHAEELREQTKLVLPDRARTDTRQALAYAAAKMIGTERVQVEALAEPGDIAVALLRLADGSCRLFKREYGEIREVADLAAFPVYADHFLERRAKELEQMAADLRAMRQAIRESGE